MFSDNERRIFKFFRINVYLLFFLIFLTYVGSDVIIKLIISGKIGYRLSYLLKIANKHLSLIALNSIWDIILYWKKDYTRR